MGVEIIGDQAEESAELSTAELAAAIANDVNDVQGDGEIDPRAKIAITALRPGLIRARTTLPNVGTQAADATA